MAPSGWWWWWWWWASSGQASSGQASWARLSAPASASLSAGWVKARCPKQGSRRPRSRRRCRGSTTRRPPPPPHGRVHRTAGGGQAASSRTRSDGFPDALGGLARAGERRHVWDATVEPGDRHPDGLASFARNPAERDRRLPVERAEPRLPDQDRNSRQCRDDRGEAERAHEAIFARRADALVEAPFLSRSRRGRGRSRRRPCSSRGASRRTAGGRRR
jgi:hypothetical protein